MVFSALFYSLTAFSVAAFFRSSGNASFLLTVFHLYFWRPLFGTGFATEIDFALYYPLTFAAWALVGATFRWAMDRDPLTRRWTKERLQSGFVSASLCAAGLASATLPFELIQHHIGWCTSVATTATLPICYLMNTAGGGQTWQNWKRTIESDPAMRFLMCVCLVFVGTICVFGPVFVWTSLNQFAVSIGLACAFFLLFAHGGATWMNPEWLEWRRAAANTNDGERARCGLRARLTTTLVG